MALVFRKAERTDAKKLAAARAEFLAEAGYAGSEAGREWLESANRVYFETAIADGTFAAWIALDGNTIAGTSGICFYAVPPYGDCPNGKTAYIMNMYTPAAYRGRDVARELFSRLLDEAKARGCTKITLNATGMGRPLYERFGFVDVDGDMILLVK